MDYSQPRERGLRPLSNEMLQGLSQVRSEAMRHMNERIQNAFGGPVPDIFSATFELMWELSELQRGNEEALVAIAISSVCEQFGVVEGSVDFDVAFVEEGEIRPLTAPRYQGPEIEGTEVGAEVRKRHLTNLLIQGNAHYCQLGFLQEDEQLSRISPELAEKSRQFIALTDRMILEMSPPKRGEPLPSPAGINKLIISEQADGSTRATVFVRAVHFPLLVHELAKGLTELLALWGLPQDEHLRNKVYAESDKPHFECGDLKYGHVYWARVREALPKGISASERSALLKDLFALPAEQFNHLVRRACTGHPGPLREFWAKPV